jgi:hypothetical protein
VLDLLEVQAGMGRAFSLSCALAEGSAFPTFLPTSIMGRFQDLALDLAKACLDLDLHFVTRMEKEMIGLGPGLTLSGDDFLEGLFFALRSLHQVYTKKYFGIKMRFFTLWIGPKPKPISSVMPFSATLPSARDRNLCMTWWADYWRVEVKIQTCKKLCGWPPLVILPGGT